MSNLAGRVWLVTGASRGIGEAIARELVAGGATVVLAARSREPLAALAAELGPERALAVPTDVTRRDECEALIRAALDRFGRLDAVVANAGRTQNSTFAELAADDFRAALDLNVLGAVDVVRPSLDALAESRGRIVFVSSISGLRGFPTRVAYSTTKFALEGFAESLRTEVASRGISVTVASPGRIATDIRAHAWGRKETMPAKSFLTPLAVDRTARIIVRAALRRRRRIVFPLSAKLAHWAAIVTPGLLDRLMSQWFRRQQEPPR